MNENNYDGNIDDKLSFKDEFKLPPQRGITTQVKHGGPRK